MIALLQNVIFIIAYVLIKEKHFNDLYKAEILVKNVRASLLRIVVLEIMRLYGY